MNNIINNINMKNISKNIHINNIHIHTINMNNMNIKPSQTSPASSMSRELRMAQAWQGKLFGAFLKLGELTVGVTLGLYRDNGQENGNYRD